MIYINVLPIIVKNDKTETGMKMETDTMWINLVALGR